MSYRNIHFDRNHTLLEEEKKSHAGRKFWCPHNALVKHRPRALCICLKIFGDNIFPQNNDTPKSKLDTPFVFFFVENIKLCWKSNGPRTGSIVSTCDEVGMGSNPSMYKYDIKMTCSFCGHWIECGK